MEVNLVYLLDFLLLWTLVSTSYAQGEKISMQLGSMLSFAASSFCSQHMSVSASVRKLWVSSMS